jgi:hypothetical protein
MPSHGGDRDVVEAVRDLVQWTRESRLNGPFPTVVFHVLPPLYGIDLTALTDMQSVLSEQGLRVELAPLENTDQTFFS